MKTTTKRILLSTIFALFALLCGWLLLPKVETSVSAEAVLNGPTYQSEYALGADVPLGDATISVNGKAAKAKCVVYTPDGTAYTGRYITLDACGTYSVVYSCEIDGQSYVKSVDFSVYQPTVTLKNQYTSKSYYGEHPVYKDLGEGLYLDLICGTEVVFNQVININDMTANDPFLKFFVTPRTISIPDVSYLFIRLTDVHDETNVVTLAGHNNSQYPGSSWWLAAGPGQEYTSTSAQGWRYGLSNQYGAGGYGFAGMEVHTPPYVYKMNEFSIRYDSAAHSLYTGPGKWVTSLSEPQIYNRLWGGFTTGEVRVSMEVQTFEPSAEIFVTELLGCDLSQTNVTDLKAPVLNIDFEGNDPQHLIAKRGVAYKLFDATAIDVQSGVVNDEVSVKVYKNYGSSFQVQINVKDNQFIPKDLGNYVVVYETKDYLGNVTKREYVIKSVENPAKPVVTLSNDKQTEVFVGNQVDVAQFDVDCIGAADVKISVLSPDGQDVYTENGFIPYDVGEFTVKYNVTDYLGQTTETEYTVNVFAGNTSLFYENVVLPKYVLAGYSYSLPALNAYDYRSGEEVIRKAKVDVEYLDVSKKDTVASGESYTFKADYEGALKITYYDESCAENRREYTALAILVKDGVALSFDKYFVTENAEITQKYDYLEVTTTEVSSSLAFAQKLLTGNFETFFIVENGSGISSIELSFENYENEQEGFTVKYAKSGSGVGVYVNDDFVAETNYSFVSTGTEAQFAAKIVNGELTTGGLLIQLSKYMENVFDYAYFTLRINGAKDSKIQLQQISGQYFFEDGTDLTAPSIQVTGIGNTFFNVNETYRLDNEMLAADVLDPNTRVTLSVVAPDNGYVIANDGTVLKEVAVGVYEFELTLYGSYTVYYNAYDSHNGIANVFQYKVFVLDDVAPEITLSGKVPSTAEVNKKCILPTATVTDNMSMTNKTVYVYVMHPSNKVVEVAEDNSFAPDKKGVYRVIYLATDDFGNIGTVSFEITVK